MVQRLKKILMAWWEHRPIVSEYVFVNVEEHAFCKEYRGQPFTNRQHFMERLCKKAGVREFGFHAIRHLQTLGLKQTQEAMETVMGQRGPTKVVSIQKASQE